MDSDKFNTLTQDEIKTLAQGNILPIESRERLKETNYELFKAHQQEKSKVINNLCDELRSGTLSQGEINRIESLIDINKEVKSHNLNKDIINLFNELRSQLLN
jgi:hypothetical protein